MVDSTAVLIFVVILIELTNTNTNTNTNTVFVNSTNISTNIETAVLSMSSHYLWMIWLSLTNSISEQDPNT